MTTSFILFHAENVNEDRNSICHLILVPVLDGKIQESQHFYMNPDAPYYMVSSGISPKKVESFDPVSKVWPQIQATIDEYPIAVCSADGYSALSLFGTLSRLNVPFNPIRYCNAKSILRRSMKEVSYSLDYLSAKYYGDFLTAGMPTAIAERWAELVVKSLENKNASSLEDYLTEVKINIGTIIKDEFTPSKCIRDYAVRAANLLDTSSIEVDAQPDNPFFGMTVVFTGKLESMKRDDARTAVIKIGGFAPERLTKETDFLVVGAQDLRVVGEAGLSGKMKTAKKYSDAGSLIEIINEPEFLEMLNS